MGCFTDNRTRILDPQMVFGRSIDDCVTKCANKNKVFAGMEVYVKVSFVTAAENIQREKQMLPDLTQ